MESIDRLTGQKQDIAQTLKELGRVGDKSLNVMADSLRDDVAELCSLVSRNAGRLDVERYGNNQAYTSQVEELSDNMTMLCDQISLDVQQINEQLALRDMDQIHMRRYDDIQETITHFAVDFVQNASKDLIREIQKVKEQLKTRDVDARSTTDTDVGGDERG